MHRESDLQGHRITAKPKLYYTFFHKEVQNLLLKGGILDDLFHINNGGNRLSIIAELSNQLADVDVRRLIVEFNDYAEVIAAIIDVEQVIKDTALYE